MTIIAATLLLSCPGYAWTMTETGQTTGSVVTNDGDAAFVMLPAFATPPLTMKIDGWLPVKKLAVNDMTISGKISMGLLDSSSFTIDRISGIITSSGGFTGKCAAIAAENRQF